MSEITKNNRRITNSWAIYDMANSVYSLCIATAIFPPFYEAMTSTRNAEGVVINDVTTFFGWSLKNSALYEYALSFAFLMVALISPILSGIADYTGNKKSFMKFFVYMGSLACCSLYFFDGQSVEIGIIGFVVATIGFSGSLVYYNSYLPEIATPDQFEKLSAKGFAMGYGGSVLLLILNLVMLEKYEWFGIENKAMAIRYSFLTVGVWWAGIAQITFYNLPSTSHVKGFTLSVLGRGYGELKNVFHALKTQIKLRGFLVAFFFLSMGVQTVMFVASMFGKKVLNLPTPKLIVTVLLIQLIAIPGALLFARLANRIGNVYTLFLSVFVWIGVCVAARYVNDEYQFYALATIVGFIMGGVQSLSRATFTRWLSKDHDTASYYSFYEVTEKMAIVFGTLIYGAIDHYSSMRDSVMALVVFFMVAAVLLYRLSRKPE